jgi:hypothetical protein
MKKVLIATALILCTSQFTLAQEQEEFYVIRDNTTDTCRVVNSTELATTQKARYKQLGQYATMDDAKAAMDSMLGDGCPKSE